MQQTIAQQLGLSLTTVSNFFMNARRRSIDKWNEAHRALGPAAAGPRVKSGKSKNPRQQGNNATVGPVVAAVVARLSTESELSFDDGDFPAASTSSTPNYLSFSNPEGIEETNSDCEPCQTLMEPNDQMRPRSAPLDIRDPRSVSMDGQGLRFDAAHSPHSSHLFTSVKEEGGGCV